MLKMSEMNANADNKYKNITILSRPLASRTAQPSGASASNNSARIVPTLQSSTGNRNSSTSCGYSSQQSIPSLVSPSVSASVSTMSSLSTSSQQSNGSQSLRSTELANNQNNDNNENNNKINNNIKSINSNNNNNNNNNNNININGINENKWTESGDKSPMCRINEISRYNDIKHEYHLIEELGPPHDKTFMVALKLGETEEYRGSGPSIKKAQRNAAAVALQQTKLKQPVPRVFKHIDKSVWPMTPTVELNVLAMKLGQNAVYNVYEPPRPQPPTYSFGPIGAAPNGTGTNAYDFRGMHYQRYHVPRGPICATLNVGSRQFVGKGRTAQAARHAAAEEALKVLREVTASSGPSNANIVSEEITHTESTGAVNTNDNYIKSPISLVHEMALKRNVSVRFEVVDESGPSHNPQFITQCTVGDVVTRGEGRCKKDSKKCAAIRMMEELNKLEPLVTSDGNKDSDQSTDGVGAGDSLPMTASNQRLRSGRKKPFINKKKRNDNKIKDNLNKGFEDKNIANDSISNEINSNSNNFNINNNIINKREDLDQDSSSSAPIHPINRLIQLQQARKEKEPQFTLLAERYTERQRREFTIECTIQVTKGSNAPQVVSAEGLGPNKKVAKKNAAEAMLQLLGYSSRPQPQSILKQDSTEGQTIGPHKKIRQVKFVEDKNVSTGASTLMDISCGTHVLHTTGPSKLGRQLVPGLILMPTEVNVGFKSNDNSGLSDSNDTNSSTHSTDMNSKSNNCENISAKLKSVSSIAKEFLDSNLSAICQKKISDSVNKDTEQLSSDVRLNRMEQLKCLADTIGAHQFQVHFSDFPKKHTNNQLEYLSVVTITTVWNQRPIVSHGSGQTQEEARNQASNQALMALSLLDSTQY